MKKIISVLTLFAIISFSSCFDMNEDISLNNNGSGNYSVAIDMSSMFQMIEMLKMMDTSSTSSEEKGLLGKGNIDSTISFKEYMDTVTNITPQERELFKEATMHIQENDEDQVLNIKMNVPFKNMGDFSKLVSLMSKNGGGMNGLTDMLKGMSGDEMNAMGDDESKMPDIQSVFTFSAGDNFIEKKIDADKLADLKNDPQWSQMAMSASMMGSYKMTTTIHLPSAVKNVTGPKVKLSDDKKTVTISSSLADMFSKPESFAYRIEF